MAKETIEVLIEGGKATAAPPLGPALGPMKVNIGKVVSDINAKTQSFKGMQVPVKVTVDTVTKEYTISIGTPPASQLIIKEAGIKKGSTNPSSDFVADLKMEQLIKIAQMKEDAMLGKGPIERVKEILGTCRSMGIMVEGKKAQETLLDINSGKYDQKIISGKTELSATELKEQEEEMMKMQEEIKERRDEFLATANQILKDMAGKDRHDIEVKMKEAEVPTEIMLEVMPEEEKKPETKKETKDEAPAPAKDKK
ncbi:MAG: 50S ribosomal protein L11 [Nanoarchaeota archaeon]|nr:50S ribosomal protein L11 [Nanoarchaeota archaeon]